MASTPPLRCIEILDTEIAQNIALDPIFNTAPDGERLDSAFAKIKSRYLVLRENKPKPELRERWQLLVEHVLDSAPPSHKMAEQEQLKKSLVLLYQMLVTGDAVLKLCFDYAGCSTGDSMNVSRTLARTPFQARMDLTIADASGKVPLPDIWEKSRAMYATASKKVDGMPPWNPLPHKRLLVGRGSTIVRESSGNTRGFLGAETVDCKGTVSEIRRGQRIQVNMENEKKFCVDAIGIYGRLGSLVQSEIASCLGAHMFQATKADHIGFELRMNAKS